MKNLFWGFLFAVLGASTIHAAVEVGEGKAITGTLDLRPSYGPGKGTWIADNTAELGYQFNETLELSYLQWFQTGLLNSLDEEGANFKVRDGFIRSRYKNLWKSPDTTWAFSMQQRYYVPLEQATRDRGNIGILRNYFTFTKTASSDLSISLIEMPVLHFNTKNGSGESANQAFENRLYLIFDVNLAENLTLSLPFMFHQTKFRNYSETVANNDAWAFTVWTYPELTYTVNPNLSLGLAYYSSNLVSSTLGDVDILGGLEKGAMEISIAMSL